MLIFNITDTYSHHEGVFTDSKVFVPHAVNTDKGFGHFWLKLVERNVHFKVDIVFHRQVLAQILQILKKDPQF